VVESASVRGTKTCRPSSSAHVDSKVSVNVSTSKRKKDSVKHDDKPLDESEPLSTTEIDGVLIVN
jgi:hypothetical protein